MKKAILISVFFALLIPIKSNAGNGEGLLYRANGGKPAYVCPKRTNTGGSQLPIYQHNRTSYDNSNWLPVYQPIKPVKTYNPVGLSIMEIIRKNYKRGYK